MGHDKLYRVGNKLLIFITVFNSRMRFQEKPPVCQSNVLRFYCKFDQFIQFIQFIHQTRRYKGKQREYASWGCIKRRCYTIKCIKHKALICWEQWGLTMYEWIESVPLSYLFYDECKSSGCILYQRAESSRAAVLQQQHVLLQCEHMQPAATFRPGKRKHRQEMTF